MLQEERQRRGQILRVSEREGVDTGTKTALGWTGHTTAFEARPNSRCVMLWHALIWRVMCSGKGSGSEQLYCSILVFSHLPGK